MKTAPALLGLVGAFGALAPAASADIVTGRVLDAFGNPVFGVDIDIDNIGSGGDPDITGDHTAADGTFSIVVPAGLYDVWFYPPAPPASTSLVTVRETVSVVGTRDLGDVVLPAGHALTGRVLGLNGVPVAGMDIDVIDPITGDQYEMNNDLTDALGNFSIAVPDAPCEVDFDGASGLGALLVSQHFDLDLDADLDLGDMQFEAGFPLTGRVTDLGGLGIFNADLDVLRADGSPVHTSGDNTNGLGNFSVVVPAGSLTVEVRPLFSSPVAGERFEGVTVAGATNMGTLALQPARTVSGSVTRFDGAPQTSGDIDLRDSVTGDDVFIVFDDIAPNGTYAIRVPVGTWDLVFEPNGFAEPLGSDVHANYVVSANQVLDAQLPSCPFPTNYGTGIAGAGGFTPHMGFVGGAPRHKNGAFKLTVEETVGGAFGYVFVGFGAAALPLAGGGTALIDIFGPLVQFPFVANGPVGVPGAGTGFVPLPVKSDILGLTIYAQAIAVDASLPGFLSLTDANVTTFCP